MASAKMLGNSMTFVPGFEVVVCCFSRLSSSTPHRRHHELSRDDPLSRGLSLYVFLDKGRVMKGLKEETTVVFERTENGFNRSFERGKPFGIKPLSKRITKSEIVCVR